MYQDAEGKVDWAVLRWLALSREIRTWCSSSLSHRQQWKTPEVLGTAACHQGSPWQWSFRQRSVFLYRIVPGNLGAVVQGDLLKQEIKSVVGREKEVNSVAYFLGVEILGGECSPWCLLFKPSATISFHYSKSSVDMSPWTSEQSRPVRCRVES